MAILRYRQRCLYLQTLVAPPATKRLRAKFQDAALLVVRAYGMQFE